MQASEQTSSFRIARISAHLRPPQREDGGILSRGNCRAKGGAPGFKVAILGASGGIGQPLSMLMKMNPLVSVLHLYDVANTPGVTADISHMDTTAVAKAGTGSATLSMAFAAAKFADASLRGLHGDAGVIECAFVASESWLREGKKGVKRKH